RSVLGPKPPMSALVEAYAAIVLISGSGASRSKREKTLPLGIGHEGKLVLEFGGRALSQMLLARQRQRFGFVDDRGHHVEHLTVVGIAAGFPHACLDVLSERPCLVNLSEPREVRVGVARGE